jgi:hypothetical protein
VSEVGSASEGEGREGDSRDSSGDSPESAAEADEEHVEEVLGKHRVTQAREHESTQPTEQHRQQGDIGRRIRERVQRGRGGTGGRRQKRTTKKRGRMMRTAKMMGVWAHKQREDATSHEEEEENQEKQNARTRERNKDTKDCRGAPAHSASGNNDKGVNAKGGR